MKKLTIPKMLKKVEKKFNKYIRERDGKKCYTCNYIGDHIQAGHFITVSHQSTRFDEDNVHGQCPRCNCWEEGNRIEYQKRMIDEYGLKFVQNLIFRSKQPKHWTMEELEGLDICYSFDKVSLQETMTSYTRALTRAGLNNGKLTNKLGEK